MSQNEDKIEVPLKQRKIKKPELNEGVVNFSPYQIALKNQMEMKGYQPGKPEPYKIAPAQPLISMPRNSIQKKEQTIRIDSEIESTGSQQNINYDHRDPNAPVIRDNGNFKYYTINSYTNFKLKLKGIFELIFL